MNDIDVLRIEAARISKVVPGTCWYLFGSILKSPNQASDIDVAVLCPSHKEVELVREEGRRLCERLPLHLMLLTLSEEQQLGFIESEGCQRLCF